MKTRTYPRTAIYAGLLALLLTPALAAGKDEGPPKPGGEKVTDYYRRELPHWIIGEKHDGGFRMEYSEDGYKRIVAITTNHGRTHIGLASVGEPAAN